MFLAVSYGQLIAVFLFLFVFVFGFIAWILVRATRRRR